jgi:hypothetical protein
MMSLLLALLSQPVLVQPAPPAPAVSGTRIRRPPIDHGALQLGNCNGSPDLVDMRRVMFLENKRLDYVLPSGLHRFEVDGENLRIIDISESGTGYAYSYRVDLELERELGPMDLIVKLALFQGRLMVFWKESYLHRSYRQGLLTVEAPDLRLVPFCIGSGGSDS